MSFTRFFFFSLSFKVNPESYESMSEFCHLAEPRCTDPKVELL